MELAGYVEALKQDLATVAAVGDEHVARAARLLTVALESALTRRLLDALGEAALELGDQLSDARVEVRLAGDDVQLVTVREDGAGAADDEAATARITLRLPESLKERVEAAANGAGVSVNTWIVQQLGRAAAGGRARPGRRLSGYGRS
jgi:HicB family